MTSRQSYITAYDDFSPSLYDRLHARFLRLSGGEGQSAVEGAITALLKPGLRVLDAGSGTGRLARRLLISEPDLDVTLLDFNPSLLQASRGLPVRRIHGDITKIALADGQFDLTLALWAIEASGDPTRAVCELARVTKDGGYICLLFCSQRENVDLIDRAVEWSIKRKRTGRFLEPAFFTNALKAYGAESVRTLGCRGPVTAILARMGVRT
ncbi:class I SAM-dependent methyltransferase [Rhodophyticola sp.]|jgi:ubiquinone/menaquinone biosynthesis C-methylase UbiE|uniref:class I SAM-dependent methyltransferase n=1 Tax=Rhodophyticola sp. TaxID=2680032 RepID=UPI003D2CC758